MALIQVIGNCSYSQNWIDSFFNRVISVSKSGNGSLVKMDNYGTDFYSSFSPNEIINLSVDWYKVDRRPFILDMQKNIDLPNRIKALRTKPKKYIISQQFI